MRGQGSEIAFPDAILLCADFPQSAFRLQVERPGQTRALRCKSLLYPAHKDDI